MQSILVYVCGNLIVTVLNIGSDEHAGGWCSARNTFRGMGFPCCLYDVLTDVLWSRNRKPAPTSAAVGSVWKWSSNPPSSFHP